MSHRRDQHYRNSSRTASPFELPRINKSQPRDHHLLVETPASGITKVRSSGCISSIDLLRPLSGSILRGVKAEPMLPHTPSPRSVRTLGEKTFSSSKELDSGTAEAAIRSGSSVAAVGTTAITTTTTSSSSSSSTINAATTAGATATGTATTTTTGTTVSTTQQPSPRPSSSSTRGTRRRSSTLSSSRTTTIPSTGCSQDQQDQPKSLLTSVYSTSKRERGEIKNTSSARRVSSPRIHVKGYNVGRTIGEGAFGKVKFARRVSGGQGLVIKIMEKKGIDDLKRVNQIFGEMFILTSLRHKNVIQLYDVVNQYNNIILVMEYAEGGELSKLIEKHLYLSESHASRLFSQILDGLVYCHRLKVIHRDLKLENILLDSEGNIKIVDFGLSERLLGDAKLESVCGTPLYMSPELMRGQKYDGSTDVWSLGVVLYAMVCGFLPFAAKNLQNLSQKVCNGFFTIPSFLSKGLTDLIRSMLEVKSLDRLPLESIQNHSWAMMTEYLGGGGEENDTKRKMTFSEVAKLKEECHRDADTKLAKMRVSKLRPQQQQQQQQQQHVRGRSDTTNYSSNQRAAAAAAGLATPRINTSPHARLHPHVQDVGAIAGGGEDSLARLVNRRGLYSKISKKNNHVIIGSSPRPGSHRRVVSSQHRRSPTGGSAVVPRRRWKSPTSGFSSGGLEVVTPRTVGWGSRKLSTPRTNGMRKNVNQLQNLKKINRNRITSNNL